MINSHKFKKICYNDSFEIFIKDKMMKVSLKNVGMLDEAEFEVGDLTIICGENNTGKTYATYSLYGYLDFVNNDDSRFVVLEIIEDIVNQYKGFIDVVDEYTIKISLNSAKSIIGRLV